jgi:hypothetical protein
MWYWITDLQQLPCSVQILHLASVELPGPTVRRLCRSPHVAQLSALGPLVQVMHREGATTMLWTLCVILLVLWALGMATSYTASGLIHILLVVALVVLVVRLIQGRRIVS